MDGISYLASQHARWTSYVTVTAVRLPAGWRLPAHHHPGEYEILVLRWGKLEAVVDGNSYAAGPGEVMMYSVGMSHAERNAGTGPLDAIYIGFALAGRPPVRFPVHSADPAGRIQQAAQWMLAQSPATTDAQRAALHASLLALLAEHSAKGTGEELDMVTRVRGYVRANLAGRITLDDLAGTAGLSRFHFARAFRRATGRTPMQFVQQMRLDAAHGMLMTGTAPLRQIARATGFSDEFHLSKTFRRRLGRSPSELRRHRPG